MAATADRHRHRIRVVGTVQGVGFRPFVHRTAHRFGLDGHVSNDSEGVLIEVEGTAGALADFAEVVRDGPPPLARVADVRVEAIVPDGVAGFTIVTTRQSGTADVPVSVDVGPCDDCLAELADPDDRRYRHPFVNCTNCGPRYTITRRIPYDRQWTTMATFPMCAACSAEYDDPGDRRFHAQPNACHDCGPTLALHDRDGTRRATGATAMQGAVAALRTGDVVAVKGVGGFHLAVDACNDRAVATLRARKHRDDKPFALLVADLAMAQALVDLDDVGAAGLASPRRPIVLAPRRPDAKVAAGVAPGMDELGVMLAPSPLHHLLVGDMAGPLVLTSGNLTDEPIAYRGDEVFTRLGPLVDAVLTHDRAIHVRCDDSVARSGMGRRGDGTPRLQVVRRSRGHAPEPMALPLPTPRHLVAVGAELKNTVAVAKHGSVLVSHHLGDLEHHAASVAFREAIDHLLHLFGVTPEVVAHDLHPEYMSSKFAHELDLVHVPVQHHHAHAAACLAEHGRSDRVLAIVFDGLGYGEDDTLWGGELLACDLDTSQRLGHLAQVGLPGGAAAIREPWRMALAWLDHATDRERAVAWARRVDDRAAAVAGLLDDGRSRTTSSVGRLFDAVAALTGLRSTVTFEGQAAIALEAAARGVAAGTAPCWPLQVHRDDGPAVLDPAPLVRAVADAVDRGDPVDVVASGFHDSLARATADLAIDLAGDEGLGTVVLSGGVFQNRRLTRLLEDHLDNAGLEVLVHRRTTPNDGSISIGQSAVAACRLGQQ